jgi:hypothetical protein
MFGSFVGGIGAGCKRLVLKNAALEGNIEVEQLGFGGPAVVRSSSVLTRVVEFQDRRKNQSRFCVTMFRDSWPHIR